MSNYYVLNVYQNKKVPKLDVVGYLSDGQAAIVESETDFAFEEVLLFSQILTVSTNYRDDAVVKFFRQKLSTIIPDITRVIVHKL